jgi:P4 family phage/plasmid primase-like protien
MVNIQTIKQRISCVEYARKAGLKIDRAGDRCRSPFHDGSNTSAVVIYDEWWYSFSDQVGGDVIDLAALIEYDGDRGKAIRELAYRTGVDDEGQTNWRRHTQDLCNKIAFWQTKLEDEHRYYLHSRGILDETIERLRIGYWPEKQRITIPIMRNGYVYSWTARAYGSDITPKYLKPKNKEIYEKFPCGCDTLGRDGPLWITEGAFDYLSLEQAGACVLATLGASFGKDALDFVLNVAKTKPKVILAYDMDGAGREFTRKFAQHLFSHRIPFEVASWPAEYKDVSEFMATGWGLKNFTLTSGLHAICEQITDVEEFKNFACSAARYTDRTRLATLFDIADSNKQFSKREIKAVEKLATSAPVESDIANEIREKYSLIYIDQVGFYEWTGAIWKKRSDAEIRSYADQAYGMFYSTAQRTSAVCNLLKARCLADVNFDRKPLMTFQNGTLELETGLFREFSRNDYCSIQMSYPYDAKAEAKNWRKFISDITDDDPIREEVLQFIAGYVLFPDCRHQKIFALIGDGGNGKSVYLEVLQKLYGDENCSNVDPNGVAEAFERIYLKDSLINIGSEIDSDFSRSEKLLKKVAAGEEITACYKGRDFIKFYPRCKLVYACNELPRANVLKGLERRMVFVSFPCQFVDVPDKDKPKQKRRDLNIISKLLKELPGIFNWAYAGYRLLMKVGYFTDTPEQSELMKSFKELSNPVLVFCEECDYEGEVSRAEIYSDYCKWCIDTGHQKMSREKFFQKFRESMGERIASEPQLKVDGKRIRAMRFTKREQPVSLFGLCP